MTNYLQRNWTLSGKDEGCMSNTSDTEEIDEGSDYVCSYVLCN